MFDLLFDNLEESRRATLASWFVSMTGFELALISSSEKVKPQPLRIWQMCVCEISRPIIGKTTLTRIDMISALMGHTVKGKERITEFRKKYRIWEKEDGAFKTTQSVLRYLHIKHKCFHLKTWNTYDIKSQYWGAIVNVIFSKYFCVSQFVLVYKNATNHSIDSECIKLGTW